MTAWERERVLELAPDPSSTQAALALLRSGSVRDAGARDSAVWGRWQGSGRSPYETVVELADPPAYACSCPSRKFPCKHALALLLRWSSGEVREGEPPTYASGWLQARAARASSRTDRAVRPAGELADPEAALKRAAARTERVASGLDELDQWLRDQVRTGLAGLERAGYAHFEAIAARMVDAQAPGVAGLLRGIPAELVGEGWPGRVLDQLAALHLLAEAHRHLDDLDPGLAANVRSRVGYPVGKDEVLSGPGLEDEWLAVGMVDTVEYRLETRRVWLYGAETGRWAMLLSFAPPGGALDSEVLAGQRLRGRLHFYPGAGQVRALVGERTSTRGTATYPVAQPLASTQRRYAELVAADPWSNRMPTAVSAAPIQPSRAGEPWRLRDTDGSVCDVIGLAGDPWLLLACSLGRTVAMFGEWSSRGFRPLSVLPDDDGVPFSTALVGRAA